AALVASRRIPCSRPSAGVAADRSSLAVCRQRNHQQARTAIDPVAHKARSTASNAAPETSGELTCCLPAPNGPPRTNQTAGLALSAGCSQEKRLPSATSTANGTRNFVEETNHSQYRIAARFCFSASVSKPAIPAKSVDCQRWFAIAVHTAFEPDHIDPKARVRLIVISPAPRMVATPSRIEIGPSRHNASMICSSSFVNLDLQKSKTALPGSSENRRKPGGFRDRYRKRFCKPIARGKPAKLWLFAVR